MANDDKILLLWFIYYLFLCFIRVCIIRLRRKILLLALKKQTALM